MLTFTRVGFVKNPIGCKQLRLGTKCRYEQHDIYVFGFALHVVDMRCRQM
jgi:hypothetical protein